MPRKQSGPGYRGCARESMTPIMLGDFDQEKRERYLGVLRRFVPTYEDAEDLLQDAYLKAHLAAGTSSDYNPDHGNDTSFGTWIVKIARNANIDRKRKRKRRIDTLSYDQPVNEDGDTHLSHIPNEEMDPEEILIRSELSEAIERQIAALPYIYKNAFLLAVIEDMDYEDASELLRIPMGTLKARIYRARELLKRGLKKYLKEH